MGAGWRIELMGWLRAVRGDCVVQRFRSQKAAALLAYLAYFQQRSHPRDVLIELLWPDCSPQAGRRNLRVELTALRHQFRLPAVDGCSLLVDGPAETGSSPPSTINHQRSTVIVADSTTVRLSPDCGTDLAEFEAALQAAGRTAGAAERAASDPGRGVAPRRAAARVLRGMDRAGAAAAG